MPITVKQLIDSSGLNSSKLRTVKWDGDIACASIGIYVVSTSKEQNRNTCLYKNAPIEDNILKSWIDRVKTIRIDNNPVQSVKILRDRLSEFWLPDESILYIGKAGKAGGREGLQKRVSQFYNHKLGKRSPHSGGHWIKTLKILEDLHVHYLPVSNPMECELKLLDCFIKQVSKTTKNILKDKNLPIPFANLQREEGNRKKHGITKSKLK